MIDINNYKIEVENELENILNFWLNKTFDHKNGGFIGKMTTNGVIDEDAPKGSVLNARILWTFSAAYKISKNPRHLEAAQRAYEALKNQFYDTQYGGFYWEITAKGEPLNTRKQIYGTAFGLYGLSEFFQAVPNEEVKNWAIEIFHWIEQISFDSFGKGYLEAVARDGSTLDDMRLSPKDRNAPLSMNTHLHILEAYANLYKIWDNYFLKTQIQNLVDIFINHIINPETKHLNLFFNKKWESTCDEISYGHDIEAAWLVLEAAEIIQYKVEEVKNLAVEMAKMTLEGLDTEGGLDYEAHRKERHWWVQAEAMVGFLNAFQISGNELFLEKSKLCWDFTKKYIIDHENGEWFWGYTDKMVLIEEEYKVGFWKCPYHNARACMEVSKRLEGFG